MSCHSPDVLNQMSERHFQQCLMHRAHGVCRVICRPRLLSEDWELQAVEPSLPWSPLARSWLPVLYMLWMLLFLSHTSFSSLKAEPNVYVVMMPEASAGQIIFAELVEHLVTTNSHSTGNSSLTSREQTPQDTGQFQSCSRSWNSSFQHFPA